MTEQPAARPMQSDSGGTRRRLAALSWLHTIRSRLYLAFGAAAGQCRGDIRRGDERKQ